MTVPLRRQQLLQFIKVDGCKYENIYCVNDSLSMIITFFLNLLKWLTTKLK